jgi:methionine synthase I (cobalamin-dependent)
MADFLELLRERIVLGDGATGTYLHELGAPANHCLEELNLTRPELVARLYQEYARAGSQVIETNTFGANRVRLARFGLEDRVKEINRRAAEVARAAVPTAITLSTTSGRSFANRSPGCSKAVATSFSWRPSRRSTSCCSPSMSFADWPRFRS